MRVTPNCSSPNHISEFQPTTLAKYDQLAQTLMRHRRWDMALGSRFLQYVQYTETSLLRHFYRRVRQCYTTLHTSIATSRRRIIVWRRQGAFLLDYYDTLMETCNTRKTKFWMNPYVPCDISHCRHLQILLHSCGGPFPGCRSHSITSKSIHNPATPRTTNQKEFACPALPQSPQSETLQGNVTKFMADNNPLHLSVDLLLRDSFCCA